MTGHHDHDHDDGHRHPHQPGHRGPAVRPLPADGRGGRRAVDREGRVQRRRAAPHDRGPRCPQPARSAPGWSRAPGSTRPSRRACSRTSTPPRRELGIDAGAIPIRALENTAQAAQRRRLHALLLLSARAARPAARLVQVARLPLAGGARAARGAGRVRHRHPDDVEIRVHDSTADLRYLVLPLRPAGSEGLDEAALAALVTRDCMIGTALPAGRRGDAAQRRRLSGEPARRPRGLDRGREGRGRPEPSRLQADRRCPRADLRPGPRAGAAGGPDLCRRGLRRAPR